MKGKGSKILKTVIAVLLLLVVWVLIWGYWGAPRLSIYYNLWRLEREQVKQNDTEYTNQEAIERLLTYQAFGPRVEKTEAAKKLVKIGPAAVPYILRRMERKRLLARGAMIVNQTYFAKNNIIVPPVYRTDGRATHYSERGYSLFHEVWRFIENDDSKIREYGLAWLLILGEKGDDEHVEELIAFAKDPDEKELIREDALRLLELWDAEGYMPVVKSIYQQPDLNGSLRTYCFLSLTKEAEISEAESMKREALDDRSEKVRFYAASDLVRQTSPPDPEALGVLVELLSADNFTTRLMSWQSLRETTGEGIGTRFFLGTGDDVSDEEYREKANRMSEAQGEKFREALGEVWFGEDDTTRKTIADEWRAWYEKKYGQEAGEDSTGY